MEPTFHTRRPEKRYAPSSDSVAVDRRGQRLCAIWRHLSSRWYPPARHYHAWRTVPGRRDVPRRTVSDKRAVPGRSVSRWSISRWTNARWTNAQRAADARHGAVCRRQPETDRFHVPRRGNARIRASFRCRFRRTPGSTRRLEVRGLSDFDLRRLCDHTRATQDLNVIGVPWQTTITMSRKGTPQERSAASQPINVSMHGNQNSQNTQRGGSQDSSQDDSTDGNRPVLKRAGSGSGSGASSSDDSPSSSSSSSPSF